MEVAKYINSSYADNIEDLKSITKYILFYDIAIVTWCSE